ncbi:MAG: lysophospholipid acyltransferase family protein [Polyangia bacterium]
MQVATRALLAWLASALIRILRLTWRVRLVGEDPDYESGPLVFCFWHGRQAGLLAHPRPRPVAVLSSLSRDGRLQAGILGALGFEVVSGSSSRGGAAGLKTLVGIVGHGADAAFAVDGPRGPLHRVKPGALALARRTGAKLVPITSRASRAWVFARAWDRYLLPKPFAEVTISRGAALDPAHADIFSLADAIETLEGEQGLSHPERAREARRGPAGETPL